VSEIALRTTERRVQKAKYLAWRPVGSAMVCCSDHKIRMKWLEICCDLVSPTKRDRYRGIPGWQRLCDAWTPDLRDAWLDADMPTEGYPLGRLLSDHTYVDGLWDGLIKPIGVESDLPFAPESDMPIHRTWLWSDVERKMYFIVANYDTPSSTIEGWNGHDECDATTGAVLPILKEGEVRDPKIKIVMKPRRMVKYQTDIGLDSAKLAKIADPAVVVYPRFDAPVAAAKFQVPGDAALVGGIT
jgi:hypothetical protein